jgi:predicted ribosomally synthesized peptide with SipW-like signal peptide
MKKHIKFSKWSILPVVLVAMILGLAIGISSAYFNDAEASDNSTLAGWTSANWTQTSQSQFALGVSTNTSTSSSPDNVRLALTSNTYTVTNSPTANSGSAWTNPTYAYSDASNAAAITSGAPSGNNLWSTYGFSSTADAISQVRVGYDAYVDPGMPVYRAAGAKAAGTGAVTPALPAGMAANDICILVATTITGGTVTITATGSIATWTALPGSPIDVALGEKLYVWWGRYSSGATGPTVTPGGNHICAGIAAWYGCLDNASPIDVSATGTEAASDTTFSFATGLTTTADNEMCIVIATTGRDSNNASFSGWADGNLTNITERMDYLTSSGGGGGFGLAEGRLATAGGIGTWTATYAVASTKAYIAFALKPNYSQIRVDVSWNGGADWSSRQATNLTTSETTYWYDVTGATSWILENLADGQLQVRADAYTVGGVAGIVNLDWVRVEVTYYRYYASGTLASQVYNTGVPGSRWDAITWQNLALPSGTSISFEVRAQDSSFGASDGTPIWQPVGSTSPVISGLPAGQYKQWRVTLMPDGIQTSSPTLEEVIIYYYGG